MSVNGWLSNRTVTTLQTDIANDAQSSSFNQSAGVTASVNLTGGHGCGDMEMNEAFPAVAKVAAAITFPLIFFLGFFGNLLVIIVVFRNHKMQSTTHVLMVSLAFADLLFIAFCVPTTLANYIATETPFGDVIMTTADYVNHCTCYLSIYTLVLMSLDRFMAVVYATESRPYRTVRNTVMCIVTIWPVIWLSQTFLFVTGPEEATPDLCEVSTEEPNASTTRTLVFFLFGYLFPLCIIIVLYGGVIRRLFLTTNVGQSERNLRSKRRAANLVVIVIACFACCYLPLHFLFIYQHYWMKPTEVPTILVVQVCANIAAYMNSCINPLLYAFLSRHFRDAFLQFFKDVSIFVCHCGRLSDRSLSNSRNHSRRTETTSITKTVAVRAPELSDSSVDSSGEAQKSKANSNSTNPNQRTNNTKNRAAVKFQPDSCPNKTVIKIELQASESLI